jgi:hypothetical protein
MFNTENTESTEKGLGAVLCALCALRVELLLLADVAFGGGQTVDAKVVFGTPAWLDAVRHAAAEADRLGREMTIFSSARWSLTGGPWVRPEQAMKKLVWSETVVDGTDLVCDTRSTLWERVHPASSATPPAP